MATTPNFNWATPDNTGLVKNGALDIRTLGNAIDSSLVDLKGGTTNQVLAKNSNTDMDFKWVADASGIPATIFDAKGDLIAASAADTAARLAVGTNGQVLTADSSASTGLAWASASSFAPNLCINGAFIINQRSYASGASLASGAYGLDRWKATTASTSLTFTANLNNTVVTISSGGSIEQVIERQNVPAGTYTLSWSGTATGRVYNTGGTPPSYAASPVTFTADGLANVEIEFTASGGTRTLSLVKFERGSSATTYSLAGNTFAGELAAAQRYYYRSTGGSAYQFFGGGIATGTTTINIQFNHLVTMRATPTSVEYSTINITDNVTVDNAVSAVTQNQQNPNLSILQMTTTGLTQGRFYNSYANNSSNAFVAVSAEL